MKSIISLYLLILSICTNICISGLVYAEEDNKPFAEERIILQISDSSPNRQTLVLNVASNLLKHYGPDKIDIEIVAFGPGLRLLFKENKNSNRIDSLTDNGVRFAACQNTIDSITKSSGKNPRLHNSAKSVPVGAARIIELEDKGFKLIKP